MLGPRCRISRYVRVALASGIGLYAGHRWFDRNLG
jgi:hypothetical protein